MDEEAIARDAIRRGKPISAKRAESLLAENARLRATLEQEGRAFSAERVARRLAEADVGWWHATVANYVTSATVEDRALLRGVLAEATIYPHVGAALLAELEAARVFVALVRDSGARGEYWLEAALGNYDEALKARGG